ncbi:hypothetical protein IW261DRAFT_1415556 [Armillaria novae-zelandiae]|uniref:Uncharacterized protein n=1 Tax=Armillaria novae-zelandiae TaxID=153914 RepID=A0AA39PP62_9AGAR|nr:hypothetical protein IW261DRAFT_1415556 [Armillaria novae-zelandiae]
MIDAPLLKTWYSTGSTRCLLDVFKSRCRLFAAVGPSPVSEMAKGLVRTPPCLTIAARSMRWTLLGEIRPFDMRPSVRIKFSVEQKEAQEVSAHNAPVFQRPSRRDALAQQKMLVNVVVKQNHAINSSPQRRHRNPTFVNEGHRFSDTCAALGQAEDAVFLVVYLVGHSALAPAIVVVGFARVPELFPKR